MSHAKEVDQIRGLLFQKMELCQTLLEYLLENQDADGVSRLTVEQMATVFNRSPATIKSTLKRLQEIDEVISVTPSGIRVNHTDLFQYGQFNRVFRLMTALVADLELYTFPYKEQSERLEMTVRELQIAYGFIHGTFGSPRTIKDKL